VSESFGILRRIYQIPQGRFQENLAYFKNLLDLDEFYLTPVRNLSLGQKMRADFAASLLHDPKIVFLDEPTIGLDLLVKERIRAAIREINERTGTTVILTTHDLTDIEEVCRRIIVIDAGKVLFDGTIDALKSRFGGWRGLRFDVVPGKGGVVAEVLPVGEDLRVTEAPGSLEVRFKKDSWQVADLISRVVGAWEVRDIALEEPQMEDIVKAIYRGEVDVQGAG
jgi:ABC-2 type transport system ATP-binding protein